MSRGFGSVQRQILAYFDDHTSGYVPSLLPPGYSRNDYQAALRAIHRLKDLGKVELLKLGSRGNQWLLVCAPGKPLRLHDLQPALCETLATEDGQWKLVSYANGLLRRLEQAEDPARMRLHADAIRAELRALGIDADAVKARQAARQAEAKATLREQWAAIDEQHKQDQLRDSLVFRLRWAYETLGQMTPASAEEGQLMAECARMCVDVVEFYRRPNPEAKGE